MPSPNIWIAASDGDIVSVGQFIAADPTIVNRKDENGCKPLPFTAPPTSRQAKMKYRYTPPRRRLLQPHFTPPLPRSHPRRGRKRH